MYVALRGGWLTIAMIDEMKYPFGSTKMEPEMEPTSLLWFPLNDGEVDLNFPRFF